MEVLTEQESVPLPASPGGGFPSAPSSFDTTNLP